jgi:hypothetical protein
MGAAVGVGGIDVAVDGASVGWGPSVISEGEAGVFEIVPVCGTVGTTVTVDCEPTPQPTTHKTRASATSATCSERNERILVIL